MLNINDLKEKFNQKKSNSTCIDNTKKTSNKGGNIDSTKLSVFFSSKPLKNQIFCQEVDNYQLISLFEKNMKKIKNRQELEDKYPQIPIPIPISSNSINTIISLNKLQSKKKSLETVFNSSNESLNNREIDSKVKLVYKRTNESKNKTLNLYFIKNNNNINNNGKVDLSNIEMESNIEFVFNGTQEYDKSSTLNIDLQKSPNTMAKIISIKALTKVIPEEKKECYLFEEHKTLSINANLILKHAFSNGEIYLGSNQYKYKPENLNIFNVIINVIGELPENTIETKDLNIEILERRDIKNVVMERIVTTKSNHKINFYILEKESFLSYPYLVEVIHNHFIKGDKILLHCEQGLVRSAGLLLFYLRKYLFDNIEDANRFIGIKRDLAGASQLVYPIIERLIKKKE